jgi:predicted LPLAT superfamily acyltransferase
VFLLAACAGVCILLGRDGVETDLLALVGAKGTLVAALSEKSSSQIRVLCADERRAELCRQVFPFDAPIDPTKVIELVRTHGRGLLSAKHRAQLAAGETNKIVRSAMRRDYSGVGLFPKADDPYYFLADFAMDFRAFAPNLPEGAVLLTGDAANAPRDVPRLIALSIGMDGIALSGAPFHTYLATESSKREINTLGAVSLVAVLLIGFLLFRSFRFLLPTALALGAGFLAGSAAALLLPGRPHVLTFVFGTTLIGLGVDYCYHGFARRKGESGFVRNLTGALVTTCLAFAPLFFSEVAVLNQMAVFTIAGLVSIYAFVLLFGRTCGNGGTGATLVWVTRSMSIARAALFVLAALGLLRLSFGNDPSSFYKMDADLARGEAEVAKAAGITDSRFALVDFEKWQRENAALKAKMGVEPRGEFLSAAYLPRELTLTFDGREYLLLPAKMAEGIAQDDVRIVDTKAELQSMFDAFASETVRLVSIAFAVMVVALLAVFRRRFLSLACPVACALVSTVGVLGWMGTPVNFFQLLCFFVLVGLGIDYAIFHRCGDCHDGRSWKVVRASFVTSLVGLGMLAFTGFPVTRSMGITLGVGLVFSYLFSLPTWKDVDRALAEEDAANAPRRGGSAAQPGWADQPQRGAGKIRMWAIFTTYRILGKSFTKFVCIFIILCVYPWAKPVRDALRKFLEAARRRFPQSCEDFRLSEAARRRFPQSAGGAISPFRIMLNFAWAMVDKMDACCFMKSPPKMTVGGDSGWMKGGCFLLSTHVGCIEVLPALAGAADPGPQPAPLVHAFQQMGRDAIYTSYFVKHLDRSKLQLHAVEAIGVETAVGMQDAIRRGEIVLMAGDRPAASGSATLRREFLGCECEFPKGVFRFAKLMECPVYAITCVRTGWNAYAVEAKLLGADILGDYVAFLESAALAHPDQWYQFYDFFAGDGKLVDRL